VVNPVRHPDLVIKPVAKDEFGFWTAKEANSVNRPDSPHPVLLCEPELLQAQHLLRKLRQKFPRTVHSPSLEVIASLANSGAGIGLLPGRVARQWKNLKHLPELPVFQDEIALLYRAENRRVAAFRELAQRLEKGML
jgi:DNA-binding transcriptional LysR family regulator